MKKKDFIELTGENPSDFFGGDWENILKDWEDVADPNCMCKNCQEKRTIESEKV